MSDPNGEWLDGDELAEQARRLYEDGRFADAEAALRRALTQNPDRPDWHFNLGRILEDCDRAAEARACYLRCHQLDPGAPEPLLAAAGTHEVEGEHLAAVKLIDQALSLDRASDEAYARKIRALVRAGRGEDARDAFYVAQEFVETPTHAMVAMAGGLEREGDLARAAWCYREALRHQPEFTELRTAYARCLARQGEHPKALQNFMHVLREQPGDIGALIGCAQVLARLGREAEAIEKLNRVVELEPANADAHQMLGVLSTHASRHERAGVEFELVLKLDPTRNHVRVDLAESLMRRGRADDARETIKAFLANGLPERPGSDDASDEAPRTDRDRALATEQYRVTLARAAALLSATKLWAEAARVLDLLIEAAPGDAAVWRALARARYESGDVDGGRIASMHVLGIDATCAISHHNLGLSALRAGRLDDAANWVTRGLKANRTDEGLRRLRTRVWMARVARALRLGRN